MKDALDVHRVLLAQDVPHEIVRLPRLVLSADDIPAAIGIDAGRCVATRIYHADDRLVAVLVRAGETPHPASVLSAVGARSLRAASPATINAATDFAAALVSPVLLPADMTVLADRCIGDADVVYTATGDGGTALGIPSTALLSASRATTAELCASVAPDVDFDAELALDVSNYLDRQRGRH
jgi:prolyl-tRNA editing enzyme YbaK/EbsC (Cys-tRNA(Pro) deacylase)